MLIATSVYKKIKLLSIEKSIGTTSSLPKNKSKLLYVCIIIFITLECLNSFTIGQNTHIKNTLIPNKA